jgi:hypothetical protein
MGRHLLLNGTKAVNHGWHRVLTLIDKYEWEWLTDQGAQHWLFEYQGRRHPDDVVVA